LGERDYKFIILRTGRSENSRVGITDFKKSTLQQLRELVSRVPWEVKIKDKGIQKTRQLLKETVFKAQSKVF